MIARVALGKIIPLFAALVGLALAVPVAEFSPPEPKPEKSSALRQRSDRISVFTPPHEKLGGRRVIFPIPAGWTVKETPVDPDVCPADFWPRNWEKCGLSWRFEKIVSGRRGRRAFHLSFDFSVGLAPSSHSDTWRPPDAESVQTKSGLRGFRYSRVYDDPEEKTVWIVLKVPETINKIQYVLCDAVYAVRDGAAVREAIRELYANAVIR